MRNFKYFTLIAVASLFWQCEPSVDEFQPSKGTADFSTFVSIGDSYSAGYVDGALGYSGQIESFPNMIANQLKSVGMVGEFKQPLTAEGKSVGTSDQNGNGIKDAYLELKVVNGSLVPKSEDGDMSIYSTWIGATGPYNNVGVPGAKCVHLNFPMYGHSSFGNPFYARFATNPGVSTILKDALALNPTFFSLWIGGNDVLGYALAGGDADAITQPLVFKDSLLSIVDKLTANNALGVIGNVPDINALPYFNTIPYNALVLQRQGQVDTLNAAYAKYNTSAAALGYPKIVFNIGANAFVIADDGIPLTMRQIKANEKILLPASSKFTTDKWGSGVPIPIGYVLDTIEIKAINEATTAYNTSIKSIADAKGLALVDLNALMNDVKDGKIIDGITFSSTFVKGNTFSLDGIHATPRGSAVIANEFIKAINAKYNASVPMVNINDYRVNVFPEVE